MHVDVFCYGTLRTDPAHAFDCSHSELAEAGLLDIQVSFDPDAELIGQLGGWTLHNRTIFGDRRFVPAVSNWTTDDYVVGDLYRVTLEGFAALLHYEGWPKLYQYEVVHVVSRSGSPAQIASAVVFTTSRAAEFGDPIPGGDYMGAAQSTTEVSCAE